MYAFRFIILTIILLGFGTACTNGKSDETVIEGRVSGQPDSMNRLILLEYDDLTGSSFSAHVNRHERQGYESVSYFIHLTTDTQIIGASGEAVTFDDWTDGEGFLPNQRVSAELSDGASFTSESTSLPRYVTYQPRFLPAYTAESVTVKPFTPEDLYAYYRPVSENRYQVLILSDSHTDSPPASRIQNELAALMGERERVDIDVIHPGEQGLEEVGERPLPHYVLLNQAGILAESAEAKDMYDALSEMD
ncbi:hypothetical protein [Salisediminibacterium selenitireducens]|uniref:Lipoprotein n=1 Tax=Bacillus selenitireducens (strain ATCC 700615 / DSM 15326 / MLS10) TaxID=439292 RepID=D6XZB8_BACIE|nr:hypothetical protein [Salisediminibacterium selenitireducens]ADI00403.1 hypothetical protein Bsel_2914 [[Bacillus] selenitireducens MLS10]